MTISKRKFLLSLLVLIFTLSSAAAMPCFESFIPDASGDFVYYQDKTFTRESYVGFLYYDDSTIQMRYFAPVDKTALLPEKNIEVLVTVNPDSDILEMTGEVILSTILPGDEDAELVNYLHDMLYEFTARRSKAVMINPTAAGYISDKSWNENGIKINQDFAQFGGNVDIQYDAMIPLYNIKNIIGPDGTKTLECVTFGKISSNEDKTFSNFEGFNSEADYELVKSKNKAKSKKVTFENQKLTLDENWQNQMENCWTYGDSSVITLSSIPSFSEEPLFNTNFILRKLLYSVSMSYSDLRTTELIYNQKKNQIRIISKVYQPENDNNIYAEKLLTEKKSDDGNKTFDYFSISTYKKPYEENRTYYDKIIKSYETK